MIQKILLKRRQPAASIPWRGKREAAVASICVCAEAQRSERSQTQHQLRKGKTQADPDTSMAVVSTGGKGNP